MAPRTFAVATTLQDPLSAERLVEVLRLRDIDAFTRAGGAASSAAFAAAQPPFWDLLVPAEQLEAAARLIEDELGAIEKEAEQNALAAEEEAMSGENPLPKE